MCVYLPDLKISCFNLMMIAKPLDINHTKRKVNYKVYFAWPFLLDGRLLLIRGSNMVLRDTLNIYFFTPILLGFTFRKLFLLHS